MSTKIQPTFVGYISTTHDALLLFQAVLAGMLPPIARRPHGRERDDLIQSGSVFIFNEQISGIKRWIDGIAWSPSRILGNFLVYRQLKRPFAPGEKKQTSKRGRKIKRPAPYVTSSRHNSISEESALADVYQMNGGRQYGRMMKSKEEDEEEDYEEDEEEDETYSGSRMLDSKTVKAERALVGSLVDSYGFKEHGLIKKTMSIEVHGNNYHLISYYRPDDVRKGRFRGPSETPGLKDLAISDSLIQGQNFRVPLDTNGNPAPASSSTSNHQQLQFLGRQPHHQSQPLHSINPQSQINYRQYMSQQQASYPYMKHPDPHLDFYEMDVGLDDSYYRQQSSSASMQQGAMVTSSSTSSSGLNGANGAGYYSAYRPFGTAGMPFPHMQQSTQSHKVTAPPTLAANGYDYYHHLMMNPSYTTENTQQPQPLAQNQPQSQVQIQSQLPEHPHTPAHHLSQPSSAKVENSPNRPSSTNDYSRSSVLDASIQPTTLTANGDVNTSSTVQSPSLPPVTQHQGYYQTYLQQPDYHGNTADPRNLPENMQNKPSQQQHQRQQRQQQQRQQPQQATRTTTTQGYQYGFSHIGPSW